MKFQEIVEGTINTGNPHKGKYVIKTDMPGRKSSDIVIMPDEKAAKDMVASLSKKRPNTHYWVELVEDPNWDNPTNAELDKEMKQADDMYWKKKEKELEFGGLPHPYSKPYHFVSSFRGKVSGQGPLSGKILNKVPNSHSDWIKHGFKKSKRPDFEGSTTYYINATVLKHLVDTNKL